jgi:prepilin-type N-terminal cleavage/methylation domain-containing protein
MSFADKIKNYLKCLTVSRLDSNRGMTLVEITVAVAIFAVVMMMVTQIFITSVRLQRAFLAKTEAMNEASYMMEFISRALRMARKDTANTCGNGANANYGQPDGISSIGFMTFDGKCQEFYLSGTTLEDKKNGVVSPLTSPLLRVMKFGVAAAGWDQSDYLQPRVAISLQLRDSAGSDFILQTTVSQRNPDIQR